LQKKQIAEDLQRDLTLVEAALYVAGRPLDVKELCSVLKTRSKNKTRKLVKMLRQKYSSRNTALEILELKDERYVLQLKARLTPKVRKLVKRPLLSRGPLKTLSYVAYRQPVTQKKVVNVRGHHAYGHLKEMEKMGLISREKKGRSTVLRTTEYFADYFGLSHTLGILKRQLANVFEGFSNREPKAENG
jgi:segregation and condensation protein B